MAVVWNGPYSSTDIPAGQRFTGPSNNASAANTINPAAAAANLLARCDDGDPISAFIWREAAGNLNHTYYRSRRMIWDDTFIGTGVAAVDGTHLNLNTSWTSRGAIYAISPSIMISQTAVRGLGYMPRLAVRVRARMNGGGGGATGYVRVYTMPTLTNACQSWQPAIADLTSGVEYVQFTITGDTYAVASAVAGWVSASVDITVPQRQNRNVAFPAGQGLPAASEWQTRFVIAGIGNAVNGPYVSAIQVWEENPGG